MELINGDCLAVMKDMSDNSIDLLFADLPYGQTSCAWDCEINLYLFWEQANRVCKPDACMAFTCTVKFGNTLINSNPKNFRRDLIWVKSSACGFLNAKKMEMKKHEMIYIFYNKLPKVYTENIALHHTHKFLKPNPNGYTGKCYGGKKDSVKNKYEPSLPVSVIEENVIVEKRDTQNYKNNSDLYGKIERPDFKHRKNESVYSPPLPVSVMKEDNMEENVIVEERRDIEGLYGKEKGKISIKVNGKLRESEPRYEPSLPVSVMEIKSEKGKHATQKPIPLMEYFIKYYSREGETVLDPTMGSGGTGIACKNLNRRFIGIEKDEDIFKIALERNNKD